MKKVNLLALVLTLLLFTATVSVQAAEITPGVDYSNKKIVFLGDSITYGVGVTEHEDRFGDIVSNTLSFENYVNMGKSASTIAIRDGQTDSFTERAASVPNDADYVVVLGGINDYNNNVPIADFTTDIALMLTAIETAAPDATIILMTPYKTYYNSQPSSTNNTELANLSDYVDVMRTAANEAGDATPHVNIIDLYSMIGFDASDNGEDMTQYTLDGLHTNIAGNQRIANILTSFFNGENLMENVEWTDGYYVAGGIANEGDLSYSSLIPVEAGKSYAFYSSNDEGEAFQFPGQFHDGNEDYVSDIDGTVRHRYEVITIPAGVKYVRFNSESTVTYKTRSFLRELENYESFNVDFDANGGSEIITQSIESETKVLQPENPIKTGYAFVAWYTDEDLSTLYDFDALITSDLTLYAKWSSATTVAVISPPGETVELLGLAWYWWLAIVAGTYFVFGTKKGRKAVGLK